jgi:hypothetical protein
MSTGRPGSGFYNPSYNDGMDSRKEKKQPTLCHRVG